MTIETTERRDELLRDRIRVALTIPAAERGIPGEHPAPEILAAYHGGRLREGEMDRLRDHLLACRPCLDRVMELEEFLRPPAGAGEESAGDFETALAWRALAAELPRRGPGRRRLPEVLAASLLLFSLGLAAWSMGQHRQLAELRRGAEPGLNVPILDLRPDSRERGTAAGGAAIELAAGAPATLVLHVREAGEFADYRVEILDGEGRPLWGARGLEVDAYGTATLNLPRSFLDAGHYRLVLSGLEESAAVALEEYRLRARDP